MDAAGRVRQVSALPDIPLPDTLYSVLGVWCSVRGCPALVGSYFALGARCPTRGVRRACGVTQLAVAPSPLSGEPVA